MIVARTLVVVSLVALLAPAAIVGAFQPLQPQRSSAAVGFAAPRRAHHHRPSPVRPLHQAESDEPSSPFMDEVGASSKPSFDASEIKDKLTSLTGDLDLDLSSINLSAITSNVMEGELGSRGETYALAKTAVIFCIVIGSVPFIGDFLMLLLGPGLLVAGLGAIVVAAQSLGDDLSPWPVPGANSQLQTDGIYSKLRHPLAAGILASCAGLSIVTGSATRLLLTALLLYVLDVFSDYEEEQLQAKFPEYAAYKSQVSAKFFPQEILDELPWGKN